MAIISHVDGTHEVITNPGDVPVTVGIPADAELVDPPVAPIGVLFRKRLYEAGQFNRPIVHDEFGGTHTVGIPPPSAPALALGSGSGGSTGFVNGYITFAHIEDDIVIAESTPTLATGGTFFATGQGFDWSGIPTSATNPRVNVVRLWREVDGEVGALVATLELGTTDYTENLLTDELGPETLPVREGLDGQFVADYNANGVVPYTTMVEIYHNAGWWAGDPDHPERIYPSQINRPEAVNVDEDDEEFMTTLDGEAVTGLARHGDELIAFVAEGKYSIQGWGSKDRSIRKIDNYYGCISRYSTRRYNPDSDLAFASAEGPCSYNGRTTFLFVNMADWWRDAYEANIAAFEQIFAVEDRYFQTVQFQIPGFLGGNIPMQGLHVKLVAHYEPIMLGLQPWWVFDIQSRLTTALGTFSLPGQLHKKLYSGGCDGWIREQNVEDDADDDGDLYRKKATIVHKHQFFGDQCWDDAGTLEIKNADVFILNQDQLVTFGIYAGDDSAWAPARPNFLAPHPARVLEIPPGREPATKRQRTARTSTHFPEVNVSGKGFTCEIICEAPVRLEYRGLALYHSPGGAQTRGFTD